jgi:hydroxymethylpyrimidine pyrophosphatase-like HAD family hydrolase
MKLKWTVAVDLDGTLCEPVSPEHYSSAKPMPENIMKVNRLYDKGWQVIIYTGRGWYNYDMTVGWLHRHNVKYHVLAMGKVVAHYYVDSANATLDEVLNKDIR